MTDSKRFQIKRKGYDRFEVDQAFKLKEAELENLKKRNNLLEIQIKNLSKQRDILKAEHLKLLDDLAVKEKAAEEMARIALREANAIIDRAHDNADLIVREAMASAREILVEIARISNQSQELRDQLKLKIKDLDAVISGLELPEAPNLSWLGED